MKEIKVFLQTIYLMAELFKFFFDTLRTGLHGKWEHRKWRVNSHNAMNHIGIKGFPNPIGG